MSAAAPAASNLFNFMTLPPCFVVFLFSAAHYARKSAIEK
jgi:hypothetical protein